METARPATEPDLGVLTRLWREAVDHLDGQRGGAPLAATLARDDLERYLRDALDDPDHLLVVGSIDSVPVGMASVRAGRGTPARVADLELIYVEPRARQVGVAESMLTVVLERCASWGVAGLDAPALPGSRPAKSFFEIHGFQARLLVMHRPVPPGP